MNYRHAYHAGNFADVLKHVILTRVLVHLKLKPAPFRVIDAHAGAGRYDLTGVEAGKTAEWRDGVARIFDADPPYDVVSLLAPYIGAVRSFNSGVGELTTYPGSPLIALHHMRPDDRLVANELHADDAELLSVALKPARNAKTLRLDAYQAIKSLLPPPERRGVVLIDPPFEQPDEFTRLAAAIEDGLRRFETGVFLIWYPVKQRNAADRFLSRAISRPGLKYLDARLAVSAQFPGLGLTETGVLVVNPPFTLAADLRRLLPWLRDVLAADNGASWRLESSESQA